MKVLIDRIKEEVKESGWPVCEETGEKFEYSILEPNSFGGEGRLIFSHILKSGLLGSPFVRYGKYLEHLEDYLNHVREFRESLLEILPYADGQAYYNDKDKIRKLRKDILELENLLYKESGLYLLIRNMMQTDISEGHQKLQS